jgi:hypothetical protein
VLPGLPVSAPRHAAPLARPSARCHWGPTSPGPTCQQRRSASRMPLPSPVHSPRPRGMRHPPLSEQPGATTSVPCRSTSPNLGTPPPFTLPRIASRRAPDPTLPCLPRICFKRSRPLHPHSLLFPLALLRPRPRERHTLPSFSCLSSTPMTEPPRSSSHFQPPPSTFLPPPTVRLAYPPPLPYLGLPSPLSSSLVALGASRSHRRPSLR